MLTTEDFDFELPQELIAAAPAPTRDASRLLVVDRVSRKILHRTMQDILSYRRPGDLWVFNDSRVIPARMMSREGVEIFLIRKTSTAHWCVITNNAKRSRTGTTFHILPKHHAHPVLRGRVLHTLESGERVMNFSYDFEPEHYGRMPVPPYIQKRRAHLAPEERAALEALDEERYQTTYASESGSVAAPTAGLHFTPEILAQLPHAFITLHVGIGTFRPVKTATLEQHTMHGENYWIPRHTAEALLSAKRCVAVGTTTVRALESVQHLHEHGGTTNIFIHPPFYFRHCHALFTNFHLPRSTLLMLVASFLGNPPPGKSQEMLKAKESVTWLKEIYAEAIRERYRFFSYGDAMLII